MAEIFKADDFDIESYMTETDANHKVRKASDYVEDVIKYFHDPVESKSAKLPWAKTHKTLGFRKGEVSLWSGMNGHGKSMVLGQACTGFCRAGQKVMIASLEMKCATTLARMCRQEYMRKPPIDAIRQFHEWTSGYLYLYDQLGAVQPEKMLAVLRYAAEELKAEHAVVDSLMKCGMGEDDYNKQKHFVDQLCSIARDSGMHIHLVAHSRKQKDELSPPNKMDVRGTASLTDQVDNVITVWRNKKKEQDKEKGVYSSDPDSLMLVDKQRNGEWEGKISLWFDPETLAYHESDKF